MPTAKTEASGELKVKEQRRGFSIAQSAHPAPLLLLTAESDVVESEPAVESVETNLPVVSKPELSMRSSFEVLSIGLDDEDEVRQPSPARAWRVELLP